MIAIEMIDFWVIVRLLKYQVQSINQSINLYLYQEKKLI